MNVKRVNGEVHEAIGRRIFELVELEKLLEEQGPGESEDCFEGWIDPEDRLKPE